MLDTLVTAFLLTAVGGLLGLQMRAVRSEVADVRGEVGELRRDVRAELARHAAENREDFAMVRAEIAALRSGLTRIALAVGARPNAAEG